MMKSLVSTCLLAGLMASPPPQCFLPMGDAMGRSLANLMAGGEPMIHEQLLCEVCD